MSANIQISWDWQNNFEKINT